MQSVIKPQWPAPEPIRAYSSTRLGGISQIPYDSLNLGTGSGDDLESVLQNRALIRSQLQFPSEPCWLHQVHSAKCIDLSTYQGEATEADAAYSFQPGKIAVVVTADCLPILLCDDQVRAIAAIHAGWKGLADGIIENCIERLCARVEACSLMAWLGPAIGPAKFEVGREVYDTFVHKNPDAAQAFQHSGTDKYHANLYRLAQQKLTTAGVSKVYGGERCTYSENQYFYSYRRDNKKTGRMASVIWIQ